MKIAYVVLHYLAGQDTIDCVNSIIASTNNSEHESLIVIVDNGSFNNSYSQLEDAFKNNKKVLLLYNDKNLGFAKGNNVGFLYAKKNFKADFIVLLNNDTLISQQNFNELIVEKYEKEQYSVLGPDIRTANGFHQNPGIKQNWSLNELRWFRVKNRIHIILNVLHLDGLASAILKPKKEVYSKETVEGDKKNTILHGACLIFSPIYINLFDGLYDKTFLYMEEDILKLFADHYGFLMMYSCDLKIYHKEDVATNLVNNKTNKRDRIKYRYLIESSKVYSRLKKHFLKNHES